LSLLLAGLAGVTMESFVVVVLLLLLLRLWASVMAAGLGVFGGVGDEYTG
jgi:hypothetical protein